MCNRDRELLDRALAGDILAFEELVEPNQKRIYNLCLRMMRNPQDAEDMAQEALLKAWRNLRNFKFKAAFSTWLHRIAVNTCLDAIRRRKESAKSIQELDEQGISIPDPSSGGFDEKVVVQNHIQTALTQLDANSRSVIVLYDVQGYSYEEIASILVCPVGTVRSRLSRARKKMLTILQRMEPLDAQVRQTMRKEVK